ncbi:FKBP-type peptidyl-prolyl cis-trans isomerase [Novipirellula caenicola]|uniref:Peptidyl-prolyl cis-trans isomerase n=1 Tax=Novipirellula caenicola TaxID=1536901 RepID=A0ABP9VLA7_9BACT
MKLFSAIPTMLLVFGLVFLSGCSPQAEVGLSKVDADAPTEFTETESGLKYRILRKSDGPKPSATDRVTVDYTGWLDNGTEFDSSYARREPATFRLNEVVPGWTEGLQLIGEGGMIELEIPYQLGYGPQGNPGSIPPYATLHFKVELHEIQ